MEVGYVLGYVRLLGCREKFGIGRDLGSFVVEVSLIEFGKIRGVFLLFAFIGRGLCKR